MSSTVAVVLPNGPPPRFEAGRRPASRSAVAPRARARRELDVVLEPGGCANEHFRASAKRRRERHDRDGDAAQASRVDDAGLAYEVTPGLGPPAALERDGAEPSGP